MATYTHRLDEVMSQTFPGISDDDITQVDRNTFRQCLLTGLADAVHFGRTLARYTITSSGRVRIDFAEGGTDEGDLLVGADGIGSTVRCQLLPDGTIRDLGVRCIYGRMTIKTSTDALIPDPFNRGFCWGR